MLGEAGFIQETLPLLQATVVEWPQVLTSVWARWSTSPMAPNLEFVGRFTMD